MKALRILEEDLLSNNDKSTKKYIKDAIKELEDLQKRSCKTCKCYKPNNTTNRRDGTSTPRARNIAVTKLTLDGKVICKYNSIGQAARECGLNSGNILKVIRGKQQTTGGYRWVGI